MLRNPNVERLVLLWIEADCCKYILILQQFPISTSFAPFCIAQSSKCYETFVERVFAIVAGSFANHSVSNLTSKCVVCIFDVNSHLS